MFDLIACCMQLGSDKDWSLVFAVFDENKSWYMKENTHNQTLTSCNDTDADIYDSNVIYSKFTSPTTSSALVKQITSTVEMSQCKNDCRNSLFTFPSHCH